MRFKSIALLLFGMVACIPSFAQSDIEKVRQRVIDDLAEGAVDTDRVSLLLSNVSDDGSWPNIDYEDTTLAGWQHDDHLDNMLLLSKAYYQEGKYHHSKKVRNVVINSLEFWIENDFISENWFTNQIGTPREFLYILFLMGDDLPNELVNPVLGIVERSSWSASGARPGADMIRITEIIAKRSLYLGDKELFEKAMGIIAGEAKHSSGRGIQYDNSFQHRKYKVTSTLTYGAHFAHSYSYWVAMTAQTRYQIDEQYLRLFTDFYLDGICKMMPYAHYPDPAGKNRSITRVGELRPVGAEVPERLLLASDYRAEELRAVIASRTGSDRPDLSHSTYFWESEIFTYQRPDYYVSVRMYSNRNHNVERPYNGEGIKNHNLGEGSNFISRTGKEYYNISPLLDWQRLPGTTVLQRPEMLPDTEIQKRGLSDFVGAAISNPLAAVAFDYRSPRDPLTVRKGWFFFGDAYVALGADITCRSYLPVNTAINQCLLSGEVVTVDRNGSQTQREKGSHSIDNVAWVFHDSVAYYFPVEQTIHLSNDTASGSWYNINTQVDSPREKITNDVFKLWLDHGKEVEDGSYQYMVVPAVGLNELQDFKMVKDLEIIANTDSVQAVSHAKEGVIEAIFYKDASLTLADGRELKTESPAIVVLQSAGGGNMKLTVSDPSRKHSRMYLRFNFKVQSNDPNVSIAHATDDTSELTIKLPDGIHKGNSVSIHIDSI